MQRIDLTEPSRQVTLVAVTAITLILAAGSSAKAAAPDPTIGVNHEFLAWEAGDWTATITMTAPDGTTKRYTGHQADRYGACGQWLLTDLSLVSSADGGEVPPYQGHGVLGFDPLKGKFVGVWLDSNTDWLAVAEGSLDETRTVLTLRVESRHPKSGQVFHREFVTTKVAPDKKRLEVYLPSPEGGRFRVALIEYQRQTGEAKHKSEIR